MTISAGSEAAFIAPQIPGVPWVDPTRTALPLDIVADPAGGVAAMWLASERVLTADGYVVESRLFARRISASGELGPVISVTGAYSQRAIGENNDPYDEYEILHDLRVDSPALAIDGRGRLGVAWERNHQGEIYSEGGGYRFDYTYAGLGGEPGDQHELVGYYVTATYAGPGDNEGEQTWNEGRVQLAWFDRDGAPLTTKPLEPYGDAPQAWQDDDKHAPSLTADGAGRFLLSTQVSVQETGQPRRGELWIQRFDLPGVALFDPVQGLLTIDGSQTLASDVVVSTTSVNGHAHVSVNGVALDVRAEEVQKLVINGGPEASRIDLTDVDAARFAGIVEVPHENGLVAAITVIAGGQPDVVLASPLGGRVFGGAGDDRLVGGAGVDILQGDDGNDLLIGGAGDDTLKGEAGNDYLRGEAGIDYLYGGDGKDQLDGGAGGDFLHGDADNDRLDGGERADGESATDQLSGGDGDDHFVITDTSATSVLILDSGGVADHVDLSASSKAAVVDLARGASSTLGTGASTVTITLAGDADLEVATGTPLADYLIGNELNNRLEGGTGGDTLVGLGGADTLIGGGGIDTLVSGDSGGGSGDDAIDQLEGGQGDDIYVINGSAGSSVQLFDSGGSNDTLNFLSTGATKVDLSATTDQWLGGVILKSVGLDAIETPLGASPPTTSPTPFVPKSQTGLPTNEIAYLAGDITDVLTVGDDWTHVLSVAGNSVSHHHQLGDDAPDGLTLTGNTLAWTPQPGDEAASTEPYEFTVFTISTGSQGHVTRTAKPVSLAVDESEETPIVESLDLVTPAQPSSTTGDAAVKGVVYSLRSMSLVDVLVRYELGARSFTDVVPVEPSDDDLTRGVFTHRPSHFDLQRLFDDGPTSGVITVTATPRWWNGTDYETPEPTDTASRKEVDLSFDSDSNDPPEFEELGLANDTGVNDQDDQTTDPTITGLIKNAEGVEDLRVRFLLGTDEIGQTRTDAGGRFSYTPAVDELFPGGYPATTVEDLEITVVVEERRALDAVGQVHEATATVTFDFVPDQAPTLVAFGLRELDTTGATQAAGDAVYDPTLVGRIDDGDAGTVEGVTIEFSSDNAFTTVTGRAVTDAEGRFSYLPGVVTAGTHVWARAVQWDDYRGGLLVSTNADSGAFSLAAAPSVLPTAGTPVVKDNELANPVITGVATLDGAPRAGVRVEYTVLDAEGNPLTAGSTVSRGGDDLAPGETVGAYSFEPEGLTVGEAVTIEVRAGFLISGDWYEQAAATVLTITPEAPAAPEITLDPMPFDLGGGVVIEPVITGTVDYRGDMGDVTVHYAFESGGTGVGEVTPDDEGYFEFTPSDLIPINPADVPGGGHAQKVRVWAAVPNDSVPLEFGAVLGSSEPDIGQYTDWYNSDGTEDPAQAAAWFDNSPADGSLRQRWDDQTFERDWGNALFDEIEGSEKLIDFTFDPNADWTPEITLDLADPGSDDPTLTGVLTDQAASAAVAGRTIEFTFVTESGGRRVDGVAITDDSGAFRYTPTDYLAGNNGVVIKVIEETYGSETSTSRPVLGYTEAAPGTLVLPEALSSNPTIEITAADITTAEGSSAALTGDDPMYTLSVTGKIDDGPDLVLQTIEFDTNGDGVADSSTLTDGLGGYQASFQQVGGKDTPVSVRARWVGIVHVDGGQESYKVVGGWSDPATALVAEKPGVDFAYFALARDTGHYALYDQTVGDYEFLDGVTSDPTVEGVLMIGSEPAAYTHVEFDHDSDGVVDGYAATDSRGRFRYTPVGLAEGYWDLRARVPVRDATGLGEQPDWVYVTRTGDPGDTGNPDDANSETGFRLVAPDALQVTSFNWVNTGAADPSVQGQVAWVMASDPMSVDKPAAGGVIIDFTDKHGFELGSTVSASDGSFDFVPLGFFSSSSDPNSITATPRQLERIDPNHPVLTSPDPGHDDYETTDPADFAPAIVDVFLQDSQNPSQLIDFGTYRINGRGWPIAPASPLHVELFFGPDPSAASTDGYSVVVPITQLSDDSANQEFEFAYDLNLSEYWATGAAPTDKVRGRLVSHGENGYVFGRWSELGIPPAEVEFTITDATEGGEAADPVVSLEVANGTLPTDFNGATIAWTYEVQYDHDGDGVADEVFEIENLGVTYEHTLESADVSAPLVGEVREVAFRARVVGYATFDEVIDNSSNSLTGDGAVERTIAHEGEWADLAIDFVDPAPKFEGEFGLDDDTQPVLTGTVTAGLEPEVVGFTVEIDEDGDGYADGTAVVQTGGGFEYTLRDQTYGERQIWARAIDPYTDDQPLVGEWIEQTITLTPASAPSITNAVLEGYTGPDRQTDTPVITGHVEALLTASQRWVEFDYNGDGLVDGLAIVDTAGAFTYSPDSLPYGTIDSLRLRSVAQVGEQRVVGDWDTTVADFLHEPDTLPEITGELAIDATLGLVTGRVTLGGYGVSTRVRFDIVANAGTPQETVVLNGSTISDASGYFEYTLIELGPGTDTVRVSGLVSDPNARSDGADDLWNYYGGGVRDQDFIYSPAAVAALPTLDAPTLVFDTDLTPPLPGQPDITADPTLGGRATTADGAVPPQFYVEFDFEVDPSAPGEFIPDAVANVLADGAYQFSASAEDLPEGVYDTARARTKLWDPHKSPGPGGYAYGDPIDITPFELRHNANEAPTVDGLTLYAPIDDPVDGIPTSADPAFEGTVTAPGSVGGIAVLFDHNGDGRIDGETVTKSDGTFFYRAEGLEPSDELVQTITAWAAKTDHWNESWTSANRPLDFKLIRAPLVSELSIEAGGPTSQQAEGRLFSATDTADLRVEYEWFGPGLSATTPPPDVASYTPSSSRSLATVASDGSFELPEPTGATGMVTLLVRGVDVSAVQDLTPPALGFDPTSYAQDAIMGPWRIIAYESGDPSPDGGVLTFGLVESNAGKTSNPTVVGQTDPFGIVELTTTVAGASAAMLTERVTADASGRFRYSPSGLAYGTSYQIEAQAKSFNWSDGSGVESDAGSSQGTGEFEFIAAGTVITLVGGVPDFDGKVTGSVSANEGRVAGLRIEFDVQAPGQPFDGVADGHAITDGAGDFSYQLYGIAPGAAVTVRARVIEWDFATQSFTDPPFDGVGDTSDEASFTAGAGVPTEPALGDQVTDDLRGLQVADAGVVSTIESDRGGVTIDVGVGSVVVLERGGASATELDDDQAITAITFDSLPATVGDLNALTLPTDTTSDSTPSGAGPQQTHTLTTSFTIDIEDLPIDQSAGSGGPQSNVDEGTYSFTFHVYGASADGDAGSTINWTNYTFTETVNYTYLWHREEQTGPGVEPYLTETIAGTYSMRYEEVNAISGGVVLTQVFDMDERIHTESWRQETDPTPPTGQSWSLTSESVYDETAAVTGTLNGGSVDGEITINSFGVFESEYQWSSHSSETFDDTGATTYYESSHDSLSESQFYEGVLDARINYAVNQSGSRTEDGVFDLTETTTSSVAQSGGGAYGRPSASGTWQYDANSSVTSGLTLTGSYRESESASTLEALLSSSTRVSMTGSGGAAERYGDEDATTNYDRGNVRSAYEFSAGAYSTTRATIASVDDDDTIVGTQSVGSTVSQTSTGSVDGSSKRTTGTEPNQTVASTTYAAETETTGGASQSIDSKFGNSTFGDSSTNGDFSVSSYGSVASQSQAYGTVLVTQDGNQSTTVFRDNTVATASASATSDGRYSSDNGTTYVGGEGSRSEASTSRSTSFVADAASIGSVSSGPDAPPPAASNYSLTKTAASSRDSEEFDFSVLNGATHRSGTFSSNQNASVETLAASASSEDDDDGVTHSHASYRSRSDTRSSSSSSTEGTFSESPAQSGGSTRTATAAIDEAITSFSRDESSYRGHGGSEQDSDNKSDWTAGATEVVVGRSVSTSSGVVTLDGDDVSNSAIDVFFQSQGSVLSTSRGSSTERYKDAVEGVTTEGRSSSNGSSRARASTSSTSSGVVTNGDSGPMEVTASQGVRIRTEFFGSLSEQTDGPDSSEQEAYTSSSRTRGSQRSTASGVVNGQASSFDVTANSKASSVVTSTWDTSYAYDHGGGEQTRGGSDGTRIETFTTSEQVSMSTSTSAEGRNRESGDFSSSTDADVKVDGDYYENSNLGGRTSFRNGPIDIDEGLATNASGAFTADHGISQSDLETNAIYTRGRQDRQNNYGWRKTTNPDSAGSNGASTATPQDGTVEGQDVKTRTKSGFGIPTAVDIHDRYFSRGKAGDTTSRHDSEDTSTEAFSVTVSGTTFAIDIETTNTDRTTNTETNGGSTYETFTLDAATTRLATSSGGGAGGFETLMIISRSDSLHTTDTLEDDEPNQLGWNSRVTKSRGKSSSYNGSHTIGAEGRAVGGQFNAQSSLATSEATATWRSGTEYWHDPNLPDYFVVDYNYEELSSYSDRVDEDGSYYDSLTGRVQSGEYAKVQRQSRIETLDNKGRDVLEYSGYPIKDYEVHEIDRSLSTITRDGAYDEHSHRVETETAWTKDYQQTRDIAEAGTYDYASRDRKSSSDPEFEPFDVVRLHGNRDWWTKTTPYEYYHNDLRTWPHLAWWGANGIGAPGTLSYVTINPDGSYDESADYLAPQPDESGFSRSDVFAPEPPGVLASFGLGLLQGVANTINGAQEAAVDTVNFLGGVAEAAVPGSQYLEQALGTDLTPDLPDPGDWSRGMFVHESDAVHGWSKFLGGEATLELITGGLGTFAQSRHAGKLRHAENSTSAARAAMSRADDFGSKVRPNQSNPFTKAQSSDNLALGHNSAGHGKPVAAADAADAQKRRLPPRGSAERKAIEKARADGIKARQAQELESIRAGGEGSGIWTAEELDEIRASGKFPADAYWHHNPTVANRPDLAGDPSVVFPGRGGRAAHLEEGHFGNWQLPLE
ncbi:MAG: hypothetical protein AAGJ46_17780 [Planctomycetota bacterium]